MKKPSSSCFDEILLSSIVSVRGPLLTVRKKSNLWVLRAGHDPRAWKLKLDAQGEGKGTWKHARPDFDALLHPPEHFLALRRNLRRKLGEHILFHIHPQTNATSEDMHVRRECLRQILKLDRLMQWAGCFPREALEFLERHRFQSRRWHLLNLWLRVPEGRELFDDVPALAWLAASSWCFKARPVQRPLRSLRALMRKPRRHLLRWLDLPEGDGIIRLLRDVHPEDLNPMQAEAVCRVLRDEARRRWWQSLPRRSHAPSVHLLAYSFISFPLLCAINEDRKAGTMKVLQVFNDTMRMLHALAGAHPRADTARIESPARLLELHDRLARDYAQLRALRAGAAAGSRIVHLSREVPPPIAPMPWMRPITNLTELLREGAEMHHCVAAYESQIAARRYYVYAIEHPLGRATLGIRLEEDGIWSLAELQGARNGPVSRIIHTEVAAWLRAAHPRRDDEDEGSVFAAHRAACSARQLCFDLGMDDDDDCIPF